MHEIVTSLIWDVISTTSPGRHARAALNSAKFWSPGKWCHVAVFNPGIDRYTIDTIYRYTIDTADIDGC